MSGRLKVGDAWIERRCFEKVVVSGFVEQRLDVMLKRVVASARIVEELKPIIDDSKPEEVMVITAVFDHGGRKKSYSLLAEAFGLAKQEAA